jgi:uncharacterized membrane protein YbjE (DUF340 family)
MPGLAQILVLVAFILAGAALPRLRRLGRLVLGPNGLAPKPASVDLVIKIVLGALLLAMGFRIGNDPSLAPRLAALGELAVAAAALAVLGTMAAIGVVFALFFPKSLSRPRRGADGSAAGGEGRASGESRPAPSAGASRWKEPALLLSVVAAGFVIGLALPELSGLDLSSITSWILDALLFFIGTQFSQSGLSLKGVFLKPETLALPLATAAGSLGAGLLLVPLFGLAPGKALALAGGFGWYSLSGVLISDLGDPALGSVAFLANMVRESIALVAIPFLAGTRLPELAIGVGGATAMDVTLPLIEQSAGAEFVPASFASGALLSLAVPLIVPLFFRM